MSAFISTDPRDAGRWGQECARAARHAGYVVVAVDGTDDYQGW